MKPIKLTEQHKVKLLEICNKLFPEYNIHWESFEENNLDSDYMNFLSLYKVGNKTQESIHWFEFCMTHLAEKIFNLKDLNNEKIRQNFVDFFMDLWK